MVILDQMGVSEVFGFVRFQDELAQKQTLTEYQSTSVDWGLTGAWQSLKWDLWSQWNTVRCTFTATAGVASSSRTTLPSGAVTRTLAATAMLTLSMATPRAPWAHMKKVERMYWVTASWMWQDKEFREQSEELYDALMDSHRQPLHTVSSEISAMM